MDLTMRRGQVEKNSKNNYWKVLLLWNEIWWDSAKTLHTVAKFAFGSITSRAKNCILGEESSMEYADDNKQADRYLSAEMWRSMLDMLKRVRMLIDADQQNVCKM